jgi:DNA mismatch endonuclease (patch repair protein)
MRAIRSQNTKPEMLVRRLVHALGYRFRLHRRDLPGKPDIVFPSRRKIINVHGCFWHQHSECRDGRPPRSNSGYWSEKLAGNLARDLKNSRLLQEAGWGELVIWECEIDDKVALESKIRAFLG